MRGHGPLVYTWLRHRSRNLIGSSAISRQWKVHEVIHQAALSTLSARPNRWQLNSEPYLIWYSEVSIYPWSVNEKSLIFFGVFGCSAGFVEPETSPMWDMRFSVFLLLFLAWSSIASPVSRKYKVILLYKSLIHGLLFRKYILC